MKCPNTFETNNIFEKHFAGLKHFVGEKNIYQTVHPIWVIVLAGLSTYFTQSSMERMLLTFFAFYSVLFEMLNSSIEITNDRFGCKYNKNTKVAKELSGTVTTLSRFPLFVLCGIIFYRNMKNCNKLTSCN